MTSNPLMLVSPPIFIIDSFPPASSEESLLYSPSAPRSGMAAAGAMLSFNGFLHPLSLMFGVAWCFSLPRRWAAADYSHVNGVFLELLNWHPFLEAAFTRRASPFFPFVCGVPPWCRTNSFLAGLICVFKTLFSKDPFILADQRCLFLSRSIFFFAQLKRIQGPFSRSSFSRRITL